MRYRTESLHDFPQVSPSFCCHREAFKIRYDQIRKRRGHKKAIIAIAHTLLNCIYHMLDKDETFNYALYTIDSKPKQTYASQITEEMAIRYLQTLGYQIPDIHNTT